MNMKYILSIALSILTINTISAADVEGSAVALPFVAVDRDPVSAAMGGAGLCGTSSSAYSSFLNPASTPFSTHRGDISFGYGSWLPQSAGTNFINVAGAGNIKNKVGISAGFSYGINKAYDIMDDTGNLKGQFTPSDIQANLGLSWRFIPQLGIGASVKYAGSSLAKGYNYSAVAGDVFLMSQFSAFNVALGVSNLGAKVKTASSAFDLPTSVALGLGYTNVYSEKHGLSILADADYYLYGAFAASVGASYTYNDMVSLRAGYNLSKDAPVPSFFGVGAGVKFVGLKIDLSYQIVSSDIPLGNSFNVSFGFAF